MTILHESSSLIIGSNNEQPLLPSNSTILEGQIQSKTHMILEKGLIELMNGIPYHSWGGAINTKRQQLIAAIGTADYTTIIFICTHFLRQPSKYWNDNRERDFSGIIDAISNRLDEIGYQILETETRHYISNMGEKRLFIPSEIVRKN